VRRGVKAGDTESRPRYVALFYSQIDSMAFKTLSPAAVWLLVQIKKAWRGDDHNIELPFSSVEWKLTFAAFKKARHGLVEAGFIDIVNPGGRPKRGSVGIPRQTAIYSLSERWRDEVSKRLADDPQAGYLRDIPLKAGGFMSVWYPARKVSESQANAAKARAARERRKERIKGRKMKRRPRQKQDFEKIVESARTRLHDSMAFIASKKGTG